MLDATLFKVKNVQKWTQWCEFLQKLPEALETLAHEGVSREFFLFFKIDGECYCIGAMDYVQFVRDESDISRKHRMIAKECLEKIEDASVLYDLMSK